jgi:hypothetical protein
MAKRITAAQSQPTEPVLTIVKPTESVPVNNLEAIVLHDPLNVLSSKRYVKGGAEYKSPGEILQPVIELLRTTSGKLTLTGANEQNNANNDGTLNVSYGRLNLVARFDIDQELFYEIGILIAYDLQIPKIKIYRGAKVSACLNLCIFNAEDVVKFDVSNGVNIELVQTFLGQVTERIAKVHELVTRLKGAKISPEQVETLVGRMMVKTIENKLAHGTTTILSGLDALTDDRSKYYYKQPDFNGWLFFNSFTEYMEKRVNFFDIPDKARDIYSLVSDVSASQNSQLN